MELLKELNIKILPPTKIVANSFKTYSKECNCYIYSAQVFEFRDFWLDYVATLHTMSEIDLKTQLKTIYNCDYLMERTLENFLKWYKKLGGKKLNEKQLKTITKKF